MVLRVHLVNDGNGEKTEASPAEIGLAMAVDIFNGKPISGAEITVTDDWHGHFVLFSVGCTVTVPAGLRPDFSCSWSQEGSDPVVFQAGTGVTLQSVNDDATSGGQYSIGGLAAFGQDVLRLYGNLTS